MKKFEYLSALKELKDVNLERVENAELLYDMKFPDVIKQIISTNDEPFFFDDGVRILSYNEMLNAEQELHVGFKELGLMPIADYGDNDFLVYVKESQSWAKFNIIEEVIFKIRQSIEELLY